MQKILVIIFGVLGIVLLAEVSVLVWQKNTLAPRSFSVALSPTPTPLSTAPLLPLSKQDKKGIQSVSLTEDLIRKGYVGWQDGNFFYYGKKGDNTPTYPFSVVGFVKKTSGNNRIEIEATGIDQTTPQIKVELLPGGQVIKTVQGNSNQDQPSTIQEVKVGSKVRVGSFWQDETKDGYFLIKKLYLFLP